MCCLSGDKPRTRQWDISLAQAEFALNHMCNRSTRKSPFEIVYTCLARLTMDLSNVPTSIDLNRKTSILANGIQQLHNEVTQHLEEANQKYKTIADSKY